MSFMDELNEIGDRARATETAKSSAVYRAEGLREQASVVIRETIAQTTRFLESRRVRAPLPEGWAQPPVQHWKLLNNWIPCVDTSFYAWVEDEGGNIIRPSVVKKIPYDSASINPVVSSSIDALNFYPENQLPTTVSFAVDEVGAPYVSTYMEYDGLRKWRVTDFRSEMLRQIDILLNGPKY